MVLLCVGKGGRVRNRVNGEWMREQKERKEKRDETEKWKGKVQGHG